MPLHRKMEEIQKDNKKKRRNNIILSEISIELNDEMIMKVELDHIIRKDRKLNKKQILKEL